MAVFEVFADETAFRVLDACWSRRGAGPYPSELRDALGSSADVAIGRLVDLQLLDTRPRCVPRSRHLWAIAQSARELPCGTLIFEEVLSKPHPCAVVERLTRGPVKRKDLNRIARTTTVSHILRDLRIMNLLESEKNAKTVRIAHRPQMLWIFLLVDQLLMDVHQAALRRARRARTRHHRGSPPREGDPRIRDHVPAEAAPGRTDEVDDACVDLPPGEYEIAVRSEIDARWWPEDIRSVRLVGEFPSTNVHAEVSVGEVVHSHTAALWSERFGLDENALRFPAPRQTRDKVIDWIYAWWDDLCDAPKGAS